MTVYFQTYLQYAFESCHLKNVNLDIYNTLSHNYFKAINVKDKSE